MSASIKTFAFKAGLPVEIELISMATLFRHHELKVIKPHRTNFYHIFWLTKGRTVLTVDFVPIPIQPNTLLFVNKNRVHFFDQTGDYDGWILLFTEAFFVQTPQDTQFLRNSILFHDLVEMPIVQLDQTKTNLTLILEQLRHELKELNDAVHWPVLQNLVHNLLLLADRERRTQAEGISEVKKGPNLDYSMRFTELLDDQYQHLKTVREYALQLGISERRLQLATAEIMGKTPKELIEGRLILEAKRLLVHTTQSIKEISFELGFEEPTNFTSFFRAQVKQTPADFRKLLFR